MKNILIFRLLTKYIIPITTVTISCLIEEGSLVILIKSVIISIKSSMINIKNSKTVKRNKTLLIREGKSQDVITMILNFKGKTVVQIYLNSQIKICDYFNMNILHYLFQKCVL